MLNRRVADQVGAGRFVSFSREEWARLRAATPLTVSEAEVEQLRGVNERLTLQQVEEIYLPLSRLLNLYVAATQTLRKATDTFLGNPRGHGAIRHRHCRQRGRGKEHHRTRAAGAAQPMARSSTRRSGHDRRVPAPEPRARGARPDGPQGLPRELRRAAPARFPDRREVGTAPSGARPSTRTCCTTSCRGRSRCSIGPTS